MATPAPTVDKNIPGGCQLHTWTLTSADHTGEAIEVPGAADRCVTFTSADWTGVTAALEGSNDGTVFLPLTDPSSTAISKTADGLEAVLENPRYIRPRLSTPGSGKTIVVNLLSRSTRK